MKTLAERLKYALYKLDINQVEAANTSGISQQSINYIIRNNLTESRLSSRIAEGLKLNPEWLIYGRGEMISPKIYKIPLITDYLSLQLYLNDRDIDKEADFLLTNRQLGCKPFAVKNERNKILICTKENEKDENSLIKDYLFFNEADMKIITKEESVNFNKRNVFNIVELRIYDIQI